MMFTNTQTFNDTEFSKSPVESQRERHIFRLTPQIPNVQLLEIRMNNVTTQDSFLSIGQNTVDEGFFEVLVGQREDLV